MTLVGLVAAVIVQTHAVEVTFTYDSAAAKTVNLAGSFNNWSTTATPMERRPGSDTWTRTLELPAGKHWYKFVVDGSTWVTDPKAVRQEEDGNGNINSVLLVTPPGYDVLAARNDGKTTVGAIRHRFEPTFANLDDGQGTLTVEARSGDLGSVTLLYGGKAVPMRPVGGDEFTERYTATIAVRPESRATYLFKVTDGATMYFGPEGVSRDATRVGAFAARWDPKIFPSTPGWVQDTVFYQIFPDRFENGDKTNDPDGTVAWDGEPTWFNWFGGDLEGVRQRLPYLSDLGVSGVYFNPVFEGPSNHRYETTDYTKIDPRLGTNATFRSLARAMRNRGIRVVLDGVFNHTSVFYPPFADLLTNQKDSQFVDWYEVTSFPVTVRDDPPYKAWFGFKSMPELNFSNQKVEEAVLAVVDFWEKEAAIDGWRLDVANEVPHEFWQKFRHRMKSHSDDRWIVGEIWGDGTPWLGGDQFDSVMNYRFREAVLGLVAKRTLKPSAYMGRLMGVWNAHPPQVSRNMMNLLGSHDTPRILHECQGDARRAQFAAMLQFSWPGTPSVYYGDELGMTGGADPDNRRGMDWSLATPSNPYLSLYKRLVAARSSSVALRRGTPEPLEANDELGTFAFRRKHHDESVVVLANASESPRAFKRPAAELGRGDVVDLFGTTQPKRTGDTVRVVVPPLSVCVLATRTPSSSRGITSRTVPGSTSARIFKP